MATTSSSNPRRASERPTPGVPLHARLSRIEVAQRCALCSAFVSHVRMAFARLWRGSFESRKTPANQALFRTRTGDPLLTMEVPRRYWRARPGTRDHVSPANRLFAPCLACPRVPERAQPDVPVSYPWSVVCSQNRRIRAPTGVVCSSVEAAGATRAPAMLYRESAVSPSASIRVRRV